MQIKTRFLNKYNKDHALLLNLSKNWIWKYYKQFLFYIHTIPFNQFLQFTNQSEKSKNYISMMSYLRTKSACRITSDITHKLIGDICWLTPKGSEKASLISHPEDPDQTSWFVEIYLLTGTHGRSWSIADVLWW